MSTAPPSASATNMSTRQPATVEIIGVPLDLGQKERGTDVGPAAIRYAGLHERLEAEGHRVIDGGNVSVPLVRQPNPAKRSAEIARVAQDLFERCSLSLDRGHTPLILGGDHSVAIGSVRASTRSEGTGLIWVDAHGDYNTPDTSPSGNIHGMPLAVILGQGSPELVNVGEPERHLPPENVVLIGIRQLDRKERLALRSAGVIVFSMRDIDEQGMHAVSQQAIDRLKHCENIHLSLDMDALDPKHAPGVGTPVRGGMSYRETQLLMEVIADSGRLSAMDIVEINPMLDERNQTAKTAVDLILSALGQSIL